MMSAGDGQIELPMSNAAIAGLTRRNYREEVASAWCADCRVRTKMMHGVLVAWAARANTNTSKCLLDSKREDARILSEFEYGLLCMQLAAAYAHSAVLHEHHTQFLPVVDQLLRDAGLDPNN